MYLDFQACELTSEERVHNN